MIDRDENPAIEPFLQAIDLPAAERDGFLQEYCEGNEWLLEELRRLVDSYERQPTDYLDRLVEAQLTTDRTGQSIGPYALRRKIGRGGMADVYLAERTDGVYGSTVALKLFCRRPDDFGLMRRFELERRILSTITHPGICRLLDGGVSVDGVPYYVMEHVEGEEIDHYCRLHELGVEQILNLFLKVCHAVSHAHQHLVIHRDLKPSNILVDADGNPKLLDFGIAKVLDADTDSDNTTSVLGLTPLTLRYASPEQLLREPPTTATDVFSLAVILYELLSRRHPCAANDTVGLIQEITGTTPASMSKSAGAENTALARKLRGDLDNIVSKALQKRPEHRYPSVSEFADDIERYLAKKPVRVRGESFPYVLGRFVSRHRIVLSSITAASLFAISGATVLQLQILNERDIAEREREKSQQIQAFMTDLFVVADPGQVAGNSVTAKELLDRGVSRIENEELAPEIKADLLDTMGVVYRELGLYDESAAILSSALLLREEEPTVTLSVANSLTERGAALVEKGDFEQALDDLNRALSIQEQVGEPRAPAVGEIYHHLGHAYRELSRHGKSASFLNKALSLRTGLFGEEHPEVADSLHQLGALYYETGEYGLAIETLSRALDIRLALNLPSAAETYNPLAIAYWHQGDREAAIHLLETGLRTAQLAFGEEHPKVAFYYANLANVYRNQKQFELALQYYESSLAIDIRSRGRDHRLVLNTYNNLGLLNAELGRFTKAREYYEMADNLDVDNDFGRVNLWTNIGVLYLKIGEYDRAIMYLKDSYALGERSLSSDHPDIADALVGLGQVYEATSRPDIALENLEKAYSIRLGRLGADHTDTIEVRQMIEALKNIERAADDVPSVDVADQTSPP